MPNPTIASIVKKSGDPEIINELTDRLSLTELNSLLLEVFRQKSKSIEPKDLMKAYRHNRFVQPSALDAITFLSEELKLLLVAVQNRFVALELSPLAPLGNCSVLGLVDQNKVVSALRGTEAVADATNLMALEAAIQRRKSGFTADHLNYCAIHRHVRAQALPLVKGFTAHFKIFCAITAGRDEGNLAFEKQSLLQHLILYRDYLVGEMKTSPVKIILKVLSGKESNLFGSRILDFIQPRLNGVELSLMEVAKADHQYYRQLRFNINVFHQGQEINIGDGGFVDWTQKLTSNNKERMLTSGLGLELLLKMRKSLI